MSVLSIVQDVCRELGLDSPSTVINNTDATIVQLLAFLKHEGLELRTSFSWPELTKEHTFSTSNGTASYALPTDFDWQLPRTHWDRTAVWEMFGPLSPQEWAFRKSGLTATSIRRNFRIKGATDTQFFLDPTPSDTATCAFEYQSTNWVRPATWVTATVYAAGRYTWYNGTIYYTSAGGTSTGSTGPAADGGVTWVAQTIVYESPVRDDDEFLLEPKLIKQGIKWRFLQQKGLEYGPLETEYRAACKRQIAGYRGSKTITVGRRNRYPLLGYYNIPETGF